MRQLSKVKLAMLLAGVAMVGFALAWTASGTWRGRESAHRDNYEVARMTEKMKTVCVGRFLIDMPEDARIEVTRPRIDGFDISAFEEPERQFLSRLADRESQIRRTPDRLGGDKNLESVRDVKTDGGLVGKIFVHSRAVTAGSRANGLELEHYRYEAVTVEALVHGNGISVDLVAEDYDPEHIDNLPKLVTQLIPNPENQIPSEAGFCINRAYFRDPLTAEQGEEVMMFARLQSHPDVDFLVILAAGLKPDPESLLERTDRTPAWLSLAERLRVSKLRARPRKIAGLDGEELVRRVDEENDARVYSFWWELNGTEEDVLAPHFVFKMNTGKGEHGPVPSTLSERAALDLWDKILSGIRVRPTEARKVATSVPPDVTLGTFAWAGDTCPQSGWWLCSEGGDNVAVLGGRRQYIALGRKIPQALLLPQQTLWEKMRGIQPSYESKNKTSWKLVDRRSRDRVVPRVPLARSIPGPAQLEEEPLASVAIGSVVSTGGTCPTSGWWRCEEPNSLDGTRWFAAGSILPPATIDVDAHSLRRSPEKPLSIQRRASWRLMRHDPTPEQDTDNSPQDRRSGDA